MNKLISTLLIFNFYYFATVKINYLRTNYFYTFVKQNAHFKSTRTNNIF